MQDFFPHNPFLRLILPFLAGIIIAINFELNLIAWPSIILGFLILLLLTFTEGSQLPFRKMLFVAAADLFLFFFAVQTVKISRVTNVEDYYGNYLSQDSVEHTLLVVLDEIPIEKDNFFKCHVKVNAYVSDSSTNYACGNLIGYFRKNNFSLNAGDEILVRTKLLSIPPPKNPFEFDYKNFLENKQIHHTFFADSSQVIVLNVSSSLSPVWLKGLKIKQRIISALKNSGLSKDAYAICAALLTGYDYDINEEVSEAFSHSGTLHVLSVSGLHTGLVYLCIIFIFDLFDKTGKLKLFRFFTVIISLWCFALITGFNPPVLRAVIMFSLLGTGKIFFRSNSRNQLNILIATAFIMLCFNPFYIADVGFQLSFLAVAGIIIFQPLLVSLYEPKMKIGKWFWQSVATSFAATISTLPVTLFYFKQFPLWFFLANLIVVPAAFALLLLSVLAIAKFSLIVSAINFIVHFLIGFMSLFSSRWAYIDNIDFRISDTLLLSSLLLLFLYGLHSRSFRGVLVFFLILIFWQLNSLFVSMNAKTSKLMSVYHIQKESAFSVKNCTQVYLNKLDKKNFNYHLKPHFISFNYPDTLTREINSVSSGKFSYLFLRDKCGFPG